MATIRVVDSKGSDAGSVDVPAETLVLDRGDQAVHDAVVHHLARRRAGTASTLRKGEVAGTGAKPWRQKGTGRARAGYRQSPVWRGGAVAFGPHPRQYGGKLNRKVARLALQRAFSDRVADGGIRVLDALGVDAPKTALFAALMKALDVQAPVLFVVATVDRNVQLAARNVPGVEVVPAASVNVYQFVRYATIVVTRDAFDQLTGRLGRAPADAKETA